MNGDLVLHLVVGLVSFLAGRVSAPREVVKQIEMTNKERRDYEIQQNLNQSLLSEVQNYRALETKLRGELWETKQKLKKLQQNN